MSRTNRNLTEVAGKHDTTAELFLADMEGKKVMDGCCGYSAVLVDTLRKLNIDIDGFDSDLVTPTEYAFKLNVTELSKVLDDNIISEKRYDIILGTFDIFHRTELSELYPLALTAYHRMLKPGGHIQLAPVRKVTFDRYILPIVNQLKKKGYKFKFDYQPHKKFKNAWIDVGVVKLFSK